MPQPWEQLKNEGSGAFGLLNVFLELGPDRTVEEVAGRTGRNEKLVKKISKKFRWESRSRAFDQYLANAELNAAKRRLERDAVKWVKRFGDLREQEYEAAQKLLRKANEMLAFPLTRHTITESSGPEIIDFETGERVPTKKTTIIVEPVKFAIKDIPVYVEMYSKLSRMAMGKETERTLVNVDIFQGADKNLNNAKELYNRLCDEYADRPDVLEMLPIWLSQQFGVEQKLLEGEVIDGEIVDPPLSSSAEQ